MKYQLFSAVSLIAFCFACNKKSSKDEPGNKTAETSSASTSSVHIKDEFAKGMKRFRDPGVYVDGKLYGMLRFGELPVPLPVAWHYEEAAVEYKNGKPVGDVPMDKQRRYRFVDYLKAGGIDVDAIKELHIYGGSKRAAAAIISGDVLRTDPNIKFRFGSEYFGKPIAACQLKEGKCPDQISAVSVYIEKKPPERKEYGRFYLDGKEVDGIPYYGNPQRGGVRVYKDNRFATVIKRRRLAELNLPSFDGTSWSFYDFLTANGVKTDDIVEAWIIHRGMRQQRIPVSQLREARFYAAKQRKGTILFSKNKYPTNAIALHTRAIEKSELPQLTAKEKDI